MNAWNKNECMNVNWPRRKFWKGWNMTIRWGRWKVKLKFNMYFFNCFNKQSVRFEWFGLRWRWYRFRRWGRWPITPWSCEWKRTYNPEQLEGSNEDTKNDKWNTQQVDMIYFNKTGSGFKICNFVGEFTEVWPEAVEQMMIPGASIQIPTWY